MESQNYFLPKIQPLNDSCIKVIIKEVLYRKKLVTGKFITILIKSWNKDIANESTFTISTENQYNNEKE